jgi:NADPH:quinone reductase-like Zn-dependent oxidoreductase
MRALHIAAAGHAPTMTELPRPEIVPDYVLIKVRAASFNGVDRAIASGFMAQFMPHAYPLVLGQDAAGVVEAVGENVSGISVGDEVLGNMLISPPLQRGTIAEYAVLPAAALVHKPAELDFDEAAALPLAGATAVAVLDAIDLQPGQTVLIIGATGGVGSFAIQLAVARGATVIATGTAADAETLNELGASEVVDYTSGSVATKVRAAHPEGVDALIDLANFSPDGLVEAATAVRDGGRVASPLNAIDAGALATRQIIGQNVTANPHREVVAPLVAAAAAGRLTVPVTTTVTLDEASVGLTGFSSRGVRGKNVVVMEA